MSWRLLRALETIKPRPADAWMLEHPVLRQRTFEQALGFPAYALPDSETPSCIFGIVNNFGVGEGWMLTGEGFEKTVKQTLPLMRRLTAHLYVTMQLHRLHLMVDSSRKDSATWAKHLGFKFECGPLARMGVRGEDLDMWIYSPQWLEQKVKQQRGE
ncbi:MAG: hypothetical protein JNM12_10050 [Alphaproteobacteria bacterium]|nr:hypothetical protein [Alphaproteobacteria bacterium]